jgi:hypothetical protein
MYYSKDPNAWVYQPDLLRPALGKVKSDSKAIRLTWQASQKNKIAGFFDYSPSQHYFRNFGRTTTPEATTWSPDPSEQPAAGDLEVERLTTRLCWKPASREWTARCRRTIRRTRSSSPAPTLEPKTTSPRGNCPQGSATVRPSLYGVFAAA